MTPAVELSVILVGDCLSVHARRLLLHTLLGQDPRESAFFAVCQVMIDRVLELGFKAEDQSLLHRCSDMAMCSLLI